MLDSIISSETRIKLLLKFFLNPRMSGYLRQLAAEFGESTNGIRLELNKLAGAKILLSHFEGRNKIYNANLDHPLFTDIRNIVLKSTGIDQVISNILNKIGEINLAFIRGDYAIGKDSGLIDMVVVSQEINMDELERVRLKTENLIGRKISVLCLNSDEYTRLKRNFERETTLILMENNKIRNVE